MRWKCPSLEMGLEAERRSEVKQSRQQLSAAPVVSSAESSGVGSVVSAVVGDVSKKETEKETDEKDIQTFGPGWRVEFRPLEIQLTDFENAAFSLLTVLSTRSLLAMGYNFYLPVSLMETNMQRAQLDNAVMTQKFWVRKEAFSPSLTTIPLTSGTTKSPPKNVPGVNKFGTIKRKKSVGQTEETVCLVPKASEITAIELTLDEFFNGRLGMICHCLDVQYSTSRRPRIHRCVLDLLSLILFSILFLLFFSFSYLLFSS
jgi:Glutamate-cysteine ligase